jgi:hypothetical protein
VKNSPYVLQCHPDARASPFGYSSAAQRLEQALNVIPGNIRAFWFFENPSKDLLLFLVHGNMISLFDIMSRAKMTQHDMPSI